MKHQKTKVYLIILFVVLLALDVGLLIAIRGSHSAEKAPIQEAVPQVELIGTESDNTSIDDPAVFLAGIPEWQGYPCCYLNENVPDFAPEEIWTSTQESLDPLDDLGRCGTANSCIGRDGMPTEGRGDISSVHPTGWHTDRYDFVEGEALYNRCHLIAHQLSGDDAIPRNLITGTSYMNRDGMLPFEEAIGDYVRSTGNHVMYRVTPVFLGEELIARGVHMQAVSVEDNGAGISFNIFCYNVQPGIDIDYATGDNKLSDDSSMLDAYQSGRFAVEAVTQGRVTEGAQGNGNISGQKPEQDRGSQTEADENDEKTEEEPGEKSAAQTYVLNTSSKRFHYPDCSGAKDIAPHNKQTEKTTREDLISRGYKPCGSCKP